MRLHVINFKIGNAGVDFSGVDAINLASEAMNADIEPQLIDVVFGDNQEPSAIYQLGSKMNFKAVLVSTAMADLNRQLNLVASGNIFDLPERDVEFQVVKTDQQDFEITDANNKIDFQEDGGALAATVANGQYTATELCAAIKTALEAAGGYTYTITYNTGTEKFTIAGSADFDLLFGTGTNAATSIHDTIGYASSNNTGADTYAADYARKDVTDGQSTETWSISNIKCSGKLSSNFKSDTGVYLPIELISSQDTELTIQED